MELLTIDDIAAGEGYGTCDLRKKAEELHNKLKENGEDVLWLNCAYTDYGGDVLDRATIRAYLKHKPERIVHEDTAWNGENAFIALSQEEAEAFKEYPLLPIVEEELSELEQELFQEMVDDVLEELEREYSFDKHKVVDWLWKNKYGYYHIYPTFVDYNEQSLFEELEKAGLVKPLEEEHNGDSSGTKTAADDFPAGTSSMPGIPGEDW